MRPAGYIWTGIGCVALAVVVLVMAHSNDDLEAAIAQADYVLGNTPSRDSGDVWANLAALGLFAAGAVLILIGAVGAGVRAGRRED